MADPDAPYHAHIYLSEGERATATALRDRFVAMMDGDTPIILFVGPVTEGKTGPHPIAQYEIHFLARSLAALMPVLEAAGLRILVHPLTLDDVADHTHLGHWIGEPVELDLGVLDPPGTNQGIARFGKRDF